MNGSDNFFCKNAIYLLLIFIATISGCSIQVRPGKISLPAPIEKKIDEPTLVIVDSELQKFIHVSKPTIGTMWGARTFEIEIGPMLTESVYAHVRNYAPSSQLSHKNEDGDFKVIARVLRIKSVEFGLIDGDDYTDKMGLMGVGVGGAMSNVRTMAIIVVSVEISQRGRVTDIVDVKGVGGHVSNFWALNNSTFTEDFEEAITDISKKIAFEVSTRAKNVPEK